MISKLVKKTKKGFTLMEMLIVVAIIAILVAIMIPTFNAQLEKSREAADAANIRAAYAEVMVAYLDNDEDGTTAEVILQQTKDGWQTDNIATNLEKLVGDDGEYDLEPGKGVTCTVEVDAEGVVSITGGSSDNTSTSGN